MSSNNQVWKLPAAGGEGMQVTRTGGTLAMESADGAYLYYVKTLDSPTSLWRMSTAGTAQAAEPVKLLDGVAWWSFSVLDKGIYYIGNPSGENRLEFFSFASGTSTIVARNLGNARDHFAVPGLEVERALPGQHQVHTGRLLLQPGQVRDQVDPGDPLGPEK